MGKLQELLVVDEKPRPKSNLAQIASAAVALIALSGIYAQVSLGRLNALRASARQVYQSYSQATLQYPHLARPNYQQLKTNSDPTELVRYQIYVASMLTAYDEILNIIDEEEWISAFNYDVVDHMPYLCEQNDPAYFATFYKKTRVLVEGSKQKHCSKISDIIKVAPVYQTKKEENNRSSYSHVQQWSADSQTYSSVLAAFHTSPCVDLPLRGPSSRNELMPFRRRKQGR